MEGIGVYRWQDGRVYEGEYKDDKKHGFGIYTWADKRCYRGWWYKGKQHGLGTYLVPFEDSIKFGLWEDGKRIEWFEDNAPQELQAGKLNYTEKFRNQNNASTVNSS